MATRGLSPSQLRALNTRVVTNAHSLCSEQPPSQTGSEREAAAPLVAVLKGSAICAGGAWCPVPGDGSGLPPAVDALPRSSTALKERSLERELRFQVCIFYSVSYLGPISNYGNVFLLCVE